MKSSDRTSTLKIPGGWRRCAPWSAAVVLLAIILGNAPVAAQQGEAWDLLLQGGTIYSGDAAPIVGDVAILDGKIAAVGEPVDAAQAVRVIDCSGLVVCPGFIDLHNHSDDEILEPATAAAMNYLTQGCTTLVTGNCGGGPIDVADYYDEIDQRGAGVNIMHLLPQGNLRRRVVGTERRDATQEELERMCDLADKAMREGAWGMSTGLIYVPSSYADTDELVAIATRIAEHGGIYASHIRNEGTGLLDSVKEALEIGRRADVDVHVSHFKSSGKDSWGLVRTAIEIIKRGRDEGLTITADQYPYTASSTSLGATCIPAWARSGGRQAMLGRIDAGDDQADEILAAVRRKLDVTDNGHRIQIAFYGSQPSWSGRRIDDIAAELGIAPLELVLQIERGGGAQVVNHSINESDVRYVMQQSWVATASDGSAKIPGGSVPHPRNYGTFPRRIGFYARDEGVISVQDAIRSATTLPADILGLVDRGRIREGLVADLVVFDPERFGDQATFVDPHRYSVGLKYVFLAGQPAIDHGRATGALLGRAIRKPPVDAE